MNGEQELGNILVALAACLRDNLGELSLAERKLVPLDKRQLSADADRLSSYSEQSRMRILRLTRNMETYGTLLGNPLFEREPCDIVQLIADVCEGAGDLMEMIGLSLTFSCSVSEHVCLINPAYIREYVGQLLSNAARYTPAGGRIRVELIFRRTSRVLLSVEDSGRGIAPEKLETLFDEKWPNIPDLSAPHGAGLGLPICKRIAQGHGGTILVDSTPSKGSKFTLSIPDKQGGTPLRQSGFYEHEGGVHPMMSMLSDALPAKAFTSKNLL